MTSVWGLMSRGQKAGGRWHLWIYIQVEQRTNSDKVSPSSPSLFCSSAILDPRVVHTMNVLSPFISVLCHYSMVSPVHVVLLSIQAVHSLPRLRAPGTVPCIISFSGQLSCFHLV